MKRILYFILLLFCFACREEFIKTPLEAEFVATRTEILAGESIEFGDQSLGEPETWIWTFDGGTPASSRERKPRVLYNTPGTYKVSLKVSSETDEDTEEKINYIVVLNKVRAAFTVSDSVAEVGSDLVFTDQSFGTPTNWKWNFGPASPSISPNKNPQVRYNQPGTYSIELMVSNDFDADTLIKTNYIVIYESLVAGFKASSTDVVEGDPVSFTDESTGSPSSWNWSFPGAITSSSTDQNPSISYSNPGVYDVQLSVSNPNGDNSLLKPGYITVHEKIVVSFSASEDTVEKGSVVSFTDESTGNPTSWNWDFEGGNPTSSNVQNPQVQYNTAGAYKVELIASNPYTSGQETEFNFIRVYDPIDADFTASSTSINQGQNITLTDASSGSPTSWSWVITRNNPRPGEQPILRSGSSTTLSNLRAGTYKVKLTASNAFTSDTEEKLSFFIVN